MSRPKGGLIIDLIGNGPGDEEEDDLPPSEDDDEDPEDRAAKPNADALISNIQAQLDQLRSAY